MKAEQAIKDIETLLNEKGYEDRFYTCDIAFGWYYYILRQSERIPDWLKGNFSPCFHPIFPENFGNQMKARYRYSIKDYLPLRAYIEKQKQQPQILFGRIELLAMEACVHYQMKNKQAAFTALKEAYDTAIPNDIVMPFIELGKDMRTLITSAMRSGDCEIPRQWLEDTSRKAAYYAKHQGLAISDYEKENNIGGDISLSDRELEIVRDLYNGLSLTEIAANQKISINTVKTNHKNILDKLNARNVADIIRVAIEKKLLSI